MDAAARLPEFIASSIDGAGEDEIVLKALRSVCPTVGLPWRDVSLPLVPPYGGSSPASSPGSSCVGSNLDRRVSDHCRQLVAGKVLGVCVVVPCSKFEALCPGRDQLEVCQLTGKSSFNRVVSVLFLVVSGELHYPAGGVRNRMATLLSVSS